MIDARSSLRHVLYITYDGLTDPLGQSQILPYLTGCADATTRIVIISCEKPAQLAKGKATIERTIAGHNIEWHPLGYTKSPPILSTVKDIAAVGRLASRLHAARPFDIVHCRSYLSALIGMRIQRKGAKFVFDMRGFYADERVDGGLWSKTNPVYRLIYSYFKRKERSFLAAADHVVALTEAARQEMLSWPDCGALGAKLSIIPCCVDTRLFDRSTVTPTRQAEARDRLGLAATDETIVYLGSIGTWYMLDEMLDFFRVFLAERSAARMLFVTTEPAEPIRARAVARGIPAERVVITSAQRADVPLYVSLARYGIFFIRPTYSKMASSPTKQGELMAMGLPVVSNSGVGDTDAIIARFRSGVTVERFDDASYAEAVRKLIETPFSSDDIASGAKAFFDLEAGVKKYRGIYDGLQPVVTA